MVRPTRVLLALLCAVLAGCSFFEDEFEPVEFERSETHLDYDVTLDGVTDDQVRDLMEKALAVYRQQDKGAQSPAFLRRRAQNDVDTAKKILRAFGWYEAFVEIEVETPDDAPEAETETADETPETALVRIRVDEGRRYDLASHEFLLVETGAGAPPPPLDAEALGSPVGRPARAGRILDAEAGGLAEIRSEGRPYARRLGRDSVIDPETAELFVETTIATGPAYVFGGPVYEGAPGVDRAYVDSYRTWEPGEIADPAQIAAFRNALSATGLFSELQVEFPEAPPPEGAPLPVAVTMAEGPRRTVEGGLRYDTDAGPAARAGFTHRNLFGANETLALEALVGLDEQSANATYRVPQWRMPGQDLIFAADLRRIEDEAFDERGLTLAAGVERELGGGFSAGFGALAELSRTSGQGAIETSKLFGLRSFVAFDGTDDRLNPTEGFRAQLTGTPFTGADGETPIAFGVIDATAAAYFDLTGAGRHILAGRARLASAIASDIGVVPANRRLYSGGGGSIRGYAERFIGPLGADGDPTGGRSAAEIGLELRSQVSSSLGFAGFVEAGAVSEDVAPTFDEGLQIAVGGGVRYFSPVGPVRFDVGFPVNPRDVDDFFQFYISIGQAF